MVEPRFHRKTADSKTQALQEKNVQTISPAILLQLTSVRGWWGPLGSLPEETRTKKTGTIAGRFRLVQQQHKGSQAL